jgi:hypothetical protein
VTETDGAKDSSAVGIIEGIEERISLGTFDGDGAEQYYLAKQGFKAIRNNEAIQLKQVSKNVHN